MRMMLPKQLGVITIAMALALGCSSDALPPPQEAPVAEVEGPNPADASPTLAVETLPPPVMDPTAPAAEASITTRNFVVVPADTVARYRVQEEFFEGALQRLGRALGMTTTIGSTQVVNGNLEITGAPGTAPIGVGGQLVVDISTLASDSDGRDNRLRERWLESGIYPQATFVPTALDGFPATYEEGTPVSFRLLGDLTVREVTTPVAFDVTATLSGSTLMGTAKTIIKMTDFGFSPPDMAGLFRVQDDAALELEFTLQEG